MYRCSVHMTRFYGPFVRVVCTDLYFACQPADIDGDSSRKAMFENSTHQLSRVRQFEERVKFVSGGCTADKNLSKI